MLALNANNLLYVIFGHRFFTLQSNVCDSYVQRVHCRQNLICSFGSVFVPIGILPGQEKWTMITEYPNSLLPCWLTHFYILKMQFMEKKTSFFHAKGVKNCQFAESPASIRNTLEVSCGISWRLAIAATLDVDKFTCALWQHGPVGQKKQRKHQAWFWDRE